MKTVPTTLQTHLNQEVTTLCTCWRITRTNGSKLFFTDSDEDVVEGGDRYLSIGAYRRTAIESTATLSVDNLEVTGVANQLVLPENELQAGLFDNAEVNIFVTSWQGGVSGELKMRRGFFGDVQSMPNGTYQVELRGLMQRLGYTYTDIFTSSCRLDLGERSCGIPIPRGQMERDTSYEVGDVVIAPNAGQQDNVGTYRKMPIGDASFEQVGDAEPTPSVYWRSVGNVDPTFPDIQPVQGTHVLRGGDGVTDIIQDIDLVDSIGIAAKTIDDNKATATLYGWRRDTDGAGRFRMQFLDCDMRDLGYGRAVLAGASKMTASTPIVLGGDFTAEAWVYLNATADASAAGIGGAETTADEYADIRFNPPRLFHKISVASSVSYGTSSQELNVGQWYHVAVSRRASDGQVTTYIDGIEKGQSSGYTDPFTLDFLMATTAGTTDAIYDELRVWDVVRAGYEIRDNMKKTISETTQGLIHYWRFNDSDGAAVTGTVTVNTGLNAFEGGTIAPVASAMIHTPHVSTIGTGFENVGDVWILRELANRPIPVGARYVQICFDATSTGNYLDSVFGWTVDRTGVEMPSILSENTYYSCTVAGTTGTTLPVLGVDTIVDGGATFTRADDSFSRGGLVTSSEGARVFTAIVEDTRAVDAWFNGGVVTFETGANKGASMEVKNWTQADGKLELFLSMPFNVEAGDLFRVYPGCDKSRISCAAIFKNIINFRGYPDVPGQDDLYRYPDARQ